MGQSLLSKAVCLQKAVDTLSTQTITATTLVGCYYELPVAEGATALVVAECPAYAPILFDKLPTMVVLLQVETVMLGCLSMVFGEIAEATCIASLEVPSGKLPDDAPLKSCWQLASSAPKQLPCQLMCGCRGPTTPLGPALSLRSLFAIS